MGQSEEALRDRYLAAVERFVERVQKDRRVLAAILFGSLSYDQVWEQSDVDLYLIVRDDLKRARSRVLVEEDRFLHVVVWRRQEFRKQVEGSLQSGFVHSSLARGRLLFTRDPSIAEYFERAKQLGERDRELQRMRWACWTIPTLVKAEKWFSVKRDFAYCYRWLLYVAEGLAALEVLDHGEMVSRESLLRALELNPSLFGTLYRDLIDRPKTEANVGAALDRARAYLLDQADRLFRPLFDYLAEAARPRTATEIADRFERVAQNREILIACEWLAYHGLLEMVAQPDRLFPQSSAEVEEPAFYYDPTWKDLP